MRSSMRRKQQANNFLIVRRFKETFTNRIEISCLFSKVTLFFLIGVGACWGTLHSSFETNECRVSALLSKRELGKVKQTPSLDEHGA